MALQDTKLGQPRSTHLADQSLAPFLLQSFDAADYLNASLPAFTLSASSIHLGAAPVSLAQVSAHTQALLSTLNAQTSRLSATLTQMTDDILRSGGRLAYQVEVLRGEAIGLTEALTEDAHDAVNLFLSAPSEQPPQNSQTEKTGLADNTSPSFISQLKMLTQVRCRLEAVIKVFGEAMHWTLPPSELSLASSFISVSGPEGGADSQNREEKGREFAERLRSEIADLVTGGNQEGDGHGAAMQRIEALRELSMVWRGTSEEKARIRFVESLAKLAEERAKTLERDASRQKQNGSKTTGGSHPNTSRIGQGEKSLGFLDNLQRIRSGIYLD